MQGSNKFLLGIVIGIVLLVVVTFFVVLRQPEPTYQDNNSPDGAAHNYLLAIQQRDYERAFTYIPSQYIYPENAAEMAATITKDKWRFDLDEDFSLAVESVDMIGTDKAIVTARKTTFYNNGLMGADQSSRTFTLDMVLEDETWKISGGESYYSSCWGDSQDEWCR